MSDEEFIKEYTLYEDKIKEYNEYYNKYTLIDNKKLPIDIIKKSRLPKLNGYKDKNIKLIYTNIIYDVDMINDNIIESHKLFNKICELDKTHPYKLYYYRKLNNINKRIIIDIKHIIEDTIRIIALIKNIKDEDRVLVTSINKYNKKEYNYDEFDSFSNLFNTVNIITKSYSNNNIFKLKTNINSIVVFISKYNDEDVKPFVVPLDKIIIEFNKFYGYSYRLIGKLTKKAM